MFHRLKAKLFAKSHWKEESIFSVFLAQFVFKLVFNSDRAITNNENCSSTQSSLLSPQPSLLTPQPSLLSPQPSLLTPHSSLLTPHSSPLGVGCQKFTQAQQTECLPQTQRQ
ncbi:hypothetical protein [Coleofasciculus sp. H7-2]|uniref:hypothetical protein n=1 Tax=Coleofasciculus sp. H7-2 TaxID=3351545 RepID=UPI0036712D8C